ncbi:MAG: glycosyltransferase family 2 protein [Gemmataceae bacterium]
MRVSVIIPAYNSGLLVVEAVASALAQSHAPAEVIVIDDGSTDDTHARVTAFGPPVRYIRQRNQGVAAARNAGLGVASGEVIAFLDADDVWHPRKLELQVECLRRDLQIALLGTGTVDWPRERFPNDGLVRSGRPVRVRFEDLVVRNQFVTSSVVVRKDALRCVGEFDPLLQGPEDFDLWLRVARVRAVANLSLPLTGYRNVPGSLGKQAATMESCGRRILDKLEAGGAFRGRPWLRRKAWSYLDYSCAYLHGAAGNHAVALQSMLRSLITFPLAYRRRDVRMPFARMRLLIRLAQRWVKETTRAVAWQSPRKGLVQP